MNERREGGRDGVREGGRKEGLSGFNRQRRKLGELVPGPSLPQFVAVTAKDSGNLSCCSRYECSH